MSAQTPTFDPEDPRLTAYALGELTDRADRLAVEQVLQASPEARAALQEIRALTVALGAEYDQERLLAADNITALPNVTTMRRPAAWPRRLLLAAAVLLLLASVARLAVPGWHTQVARLAPGPAAVAPAPPVSAVVADASVARQGPLPGDAARPPAPAGAAATRFTGTLALDRSAVLKDEGSESRAAAASKALAFNDSPLSQGGLGGVPVASAPSVAARSAARRAVPSDHLSQAKLIQHADKFVAARDHPRATFFPGADAPGDIDVRRFIESGHLPPPDAVRTGEWIAAFPSDAQPVPLSLEAASCPWNPQDRLVRIGVKTREEDVEVQVAFDPQAVTAYRLIIGNNDATHRLTTLYEVVPAEQPTPGHASLTVTLRHKIPGKNGSEQEDVRTLSYLGAPGDLANASPDFKFTAAVASFAQILQGSPYLVDTTWDAVLALAKQGIGPDPDGRRAKFIELVQKAQALQNTRGQ